MSGRPAVGSLVGGAGPVRAAGGGLDDRPRLAQLAVLGRDLDRAGGCVDVYGAQAQQPLERPGGQAYALRPREGDDVEAAAHAAPPADEDGVVGAGRALAA